MRGRAPEKERKEKGAPLKGAVKTIWSSSRNPTAASADRRKAQDRHSSRHS